jgi:hypothetical protein
VLVVDFLSRREMISAIHVRQSISKRLASAIARVVFFLPDNSGLRRAAEYWFHWICFAVRHKRAPRHANHSFNDFLFQLKTSSELSSPLRQYVTDKEHGKTYITSTLGAGSTIETLAVIRSRSDLDNFSPKDFPAVFKPTHSSGRIAFIESLSDYALAKPMLRSWFDHDYFATTLERNYQGLDPKIIVEPYISKDMRFEGSIHCRHGAAKVISLIDRFDADKRRASFDRSWRPLHVALGQPYHALEIDVPRYAAALLAATEKIAREFTYVRIDFYASDDTFLFGELTNLPGGGLAKFSSKAGEQRFSDAVLIA